MPIRRIRSPRLPPQKVADMSEQHDKDSFMRACQKLRELEAGWFNVCRKGDPAEVRRYQSWIVQARVAKKHAHERVRLWKAASSPRQPVVRLG
jgi:hypothetical protein